MKSSAQENYKYTLTPKELKKGDFAPNKFIKKLGLEWSVDRRQLNGLQQLENDKIRGLKVNLELISAENQELIKKHYSQAPMLLAGSGIGQGVEEMQSIIFTEPQSEDRNAELYEENSIVYFKMRIEKYPLKDLTNESIRGYIQGPAEFFYKLDKKLGFCLQKISTNSQLIRDLYMAPDVSEKRILDEINEKANLLDKIAEGFGEKLEKLEKLKNLDNTKKSTKKPNLMIRIEQTEAALAAVRLCKENKISVNELQVSLKNILRSADTRKSFLGHFHNTSSTENLLIQTIRTLRRNFGFAPHYIENIENKGISESAKVGAVLSVAATPLIAFSTLSASPSSSSSAAILPKTNISPSTSTLSKTCDLIVQTFFSDEQIENIKNYSKLRQVIEYDLGLLENKVRSSPIAERPRINSPSLIKNMIELNRIFETKIKENFGQLNLQILVNLDDQSKKLLAEVIAGFGEKRPRNLIAESKYQVLNVALDKLLSPSEKKQYLNFLQDFTRMGNQFARYRERANVIKLNFPIPQEPSQPRPNLLRYD